MRWGSTASSFCPARDLGGGDRGVRESIEQGLILGPRNHLAITPLSPTGRHTDFTMPNGLPTMPAMPVDPVIDTDDIGVPEERVRLIVDFDPVTDSSALADPDNVKIVGQGGSLVKDIDGWFETVPVASALG